MSTSPETSETGDKIDQTTTTDPASSPSSASRKLTRAQINAQAEEIRKAKELPRAPGEKSTLEQCMAWCKLLNDEQYSHVAIYLYRTYPVIVRKLDDPSANNYIDFLTKEAVDEGMDVYIRRVHGGGRYKIIANDTEKRFGSTLFTAWLNIPIDDVMPILNQKELDLDAKANMGYLNLLKNSQKGNMGTQGTTIVSTDTAAITQQMTGMMKDMMGMYQTMSKEQRDTINKILSETMGRKEEGGITALLLEKLKQEDPNKQMQVVTALFAAMKEMMPKVDGGLNMTTMLTLIQTSFEKQLELMKLMFAAKEEKTGGGDSFIDQYLKYKEAGLIGGKDEGGGKQTLAQTIVEGVKDLALPTIGLVSQLLQMRTGVRPIVPTNETQAEELVQGMQGIQPHNMPMGSVTQPPAQQPNRLIQMPQQPNQPQQPQQQQQLTIVQQMIVQYGSLFINAIKQGMTGDEMADNLISVSSMLGADLYTILKNQGKDNIMAGFKAVPEFWKATGEIYGEAHMEKIIDDFLAFDPLATDDDLPTGA